MEQTACCQNSMSARGEWACAHVGEGVSSRASDQKSWVS